MEDRSAIKKILEAEGSVTISGKKDKPLSERISATFTERTPKNSSLILSVLESGGSVTIYRSKNKPKS